MEACVVSSQGGRKGGGGNFGGGERHKRFGGEGRCEANFEKATQ